MNIRWRAKAALVATFVVLVWAFVQYGREQAFKSAISSQERAVADNLLLEKLSGPGYFNVPISDSHAEGTPWIEADHALSQIPRIAAERQLGPEATHEIERLIDNLSEPHPYRVVGGERVNLLRLNLALDSIK